MYTSLSGAVTGLNNAYTGIAQSAQRVASGLQNVQYEKEAAVLIENQALAGINLAVIKTQDDMLGTLLDTFA